METRHVKLGFEEAISAKKNLLSCELNLLHTVKRVKNYKILRKKEKIKKTKLKTALTELKTKLKHIQSTFPKEESNISIPKKRKSKLIEQEKTNIQIELNDIQSKLAKLQ